MGWRGEQQTAARARGLPRSGLLQVNVGYAERFRLSLDGTGVLKELA